MLTSPDTKSRAISLSEFMSAEDGVAEGIKSFYRNLPLADMICEVSIFQKKNRLAKIYCSDCGLKMSSEVDCVVHRLNSGRENHNRVPFRY